jgi:hypothetical protein
MARRANKQSDPDAAATTVRRPQGRVVPLHEFAASHDPDLYLKSHSLIWHRVPDIRSALDILAWTNAAMAAIHVESHIAEGDESAPASELDPGVESGPDSATLKELKQSLDRLDEQLQRLTQQLADTSAETALASRVLEWRR